MLTVVSFKWRPDTEGYKLPMSIDGYTDKHVRIHKAMIERNTTVPHRYVCITDEPVDGVECIPLWDKCRRLGGAYNRLYTFSEDMRDIIGERFVCIDLDVVILGNIDHILNRTEPFICNSHKPSPTNPNPPDQYYNGGLYMMDAGVHDDLWVEFESNFDAHIDEINEARANNVCIGSDQEWMRLYLGKTQPRFTEDDGIYEYNQIARYGHVPANACMVFCAGRRDPSTLGDEWIKDNWHE